MPVVQEEAGRSYFGSVLGVVTPEWSEDDHPIDFDESTAAADDRYWSWVAFAAPFSWMTFIRWWIARRWVVPRDVRRR